MTIASFSRTILAIAALAALPASAQSSDAARFSVEAARVTIVRDTCR